ncbi:MAG: DUF6493 family protein [Planctomycetes bacterium]|nr:DUF6493 family protein [Planctomycetota bacterium]
MTSDAEKLKAALEKGRADQCRRLLANASETERATHAKYTSEWLKKLRSQRITTRLPGRHPVDGYTLILAAETAVVATCSLAQIKALKIRWCSDNEVDQAIRDRRPPWIDGWAEYAIEESPWYWVVVRDLVHDGLCQPPQSENFVLGLLALRGHETEIPGGLVGMFRKYRKLMEPLIWRLFEIEGGGEYSLAASDKFARDGFNWHEALVELADKNLLPRQRLLDASLSALECDFAQFRAGWFSRFHVAMKPTPEERAARGARYLGLLGSNIPPTVSFALTTVEQLDKEKSIDPQALIQSLEPVLRTQGKGVVKTALKLLVSAAQKCPELGESAALAATAALRHESADVQMEGLNCLKKLIQPGWEPCLTRIAEYTDIVAPSVKREIQSWLPSMASATDQASTSRNKAKGGRQPEAEKRGDAGSLELKRLVAEAGKLEPAWAIMAGMKQVMDVIGKERSQVKRLDLDVRQIPSLSRDREITCISDLDELIEVVSFVIENPNDASAVTQSERALDGLMRLCDQRPADFAKRIGPLAKRVEKTTHAPFLGQGPDHDLAGLVGAWAHGKVPVPEKRKEKENGHSYDRTLWVDRDKLPSNAAALLNNPFGLLSLRSLAVGFHILRGQSRPLLSAPTHEGGWIAPQQLIERVKQWNTSGDAPDISDAILALLRLAFLGRSDALETARDLAGEIGAAIRYALGDDRVKVGATAPLWVAAARAKSPLEIDKAIEKRFPNLGPDAGTAAAYRFDVSTRKSNGYTFRTLHIHSDSKPPSQVDGLLATVQLHRRHDWGVEEGRRAAARWLGTVWPQSRESYFAWGALQIGNNLDWWEARWHNRCFLELLLDPDVPLGDMAVLMLVVALAAKEPGEHGLATDIAIQAINDGRLDGTEIGPVLKGLLRGGLVLVRRLTKTLGDVSKVSPLHALVVRTAIELSLDGDPKDAPGDIHALLELLRELVIDAQTSVGHAKALEYLRKIKGTGKAAKAAKDLLNREPQPGYLSEEAIRIMLAGRVDRARRWAAASQAIRG